MGERIKKFSKYFGGQYMKYWYIAFAITVLIMAFYYINERNIKYYTWTVYDENGTAVHTENIPAEEVAVKARENKPRSFVAHKFSLF